VPRAAGAARPEPPSQAAAVAAFYLRDAASVRDAARAATFPPALQPVTVAVRLSRTLFAQLAQQRFEPPRGQVPLPPAGSPEHAPAALGLKLTAGFEMLAAAWRREGAGLPSPGEPPPPPPPPPPAADARAHRALLLAGGFAFSADDEAAQLAQAAEAAEAEAALARARAAAREPAASAAAVFGRWAAAGGAADGPAASEFWPEPCAGASDDEAWLGEGEALLERAMAEREAERCEHEAARGRRRAAEPAAEAEAEAEAAAALGRVASGVRAFVAARGGAEGARVPGEEAAALRPDRFLRELSDALGVEWEGGSDASSASSDDLSDDFDEETASEEEEAAAPGWRRFRPAAAGSDSDDEPEEGFAAQYGAAMDAELKGSAMRDDFARAEEGGEELRPVDIDRNLLQSLLASYGAQEGLPGPASNLLGALGLALPHAQRE